MTRFAVTAWPPWAIGAFVVLSTSVNMAAPPKKGDVQRPAYPRVSLADLLRSGLDEEPEARYLTRREPFSVVGRVHRADGKSARSFVLSEPANFCCSTKFNVHFNVLGDRAGSVTQGQWVVVSGRLQRVGLDDSLIESPAPVLSGGLFNQSLVIRAEMVIPSERLTTRDDIVSALNSPSLSYFRRAVHESGLDEQLRVMEKVTVFAPVDQAFQTMPTDELHALFNPRNHHRLRHLVLNHVVAERLLEEDLIRLDGLTTVSNRKLPVRCDDGVLTIGAARTVFEDVPARNGTMHLINGIIVPRMHLVDRLKERRRNRIDGEP